MTEARLGRLVAPALVALVAFAGCARLFERDQRAEGSAIWIAADSAELESAAVAALAERGIGEWFVEAGRIRFDSGELRVEGPSPPAPPTRARATLVLSGGWPRGSSADPAATGARWHALLEGLRASAETRGWVVVGYHLDLAFDSESAEAYAQALAELRERMPAGQLLSATLPRELVAQAGDAAGDAIGAVAAEVDFVVAMLYGQRPGEPEATKAWDLAAVESTLQRLESIGRPYLVGVSVIGEATLRSGGRERARTTRLDLASLVANPRLELKSGFTLEAANRLTYQFVARGETLAGEWRLSTGDELRIVRTSTSLVEELLRRIGAWDAPHHLGEPFYRVPAPGERLSLDLESIDVALAPETATLDLDIAVERVAASASRWLFRVRLQNRNGEPSDIGFYDSNFVQLRVRHGRFVEADPGEFRRAELAAGDETRTMRALRAADTVRLFRPFVDGHDSVTSGLIEVQPVGGSPSFEVSASFLLPSGHLYAPEIREWSFDAP